VTIKFLLDTNVISEPLKPAPDHKVMQKLKVHELELAIPSIAWHELLVGCYRLPNSRKRSAIEKYLNEVALPIMPYDAVAAKWHAQERARLTGLGKTPSFIDGQIAAIAYTKDLMLVTFNTTDFSSFKGLNVVNWQR
jgi:tRNA(fMet)-specific endonuclease VapC